MEPSTTPEAILGEGTVDTILLMSTPDLLLELEALENDFDRWTCDDHLSLIMWSAYWEVAESVLIERGYYDKVL